ncbi:prepilin peptidase [Sphingomonas aracearum]|uniref:prepilin peptidase n=1 Tax=Sphingomonas aracearum TaxID=2283317 RepID=UPI001EF077B9|nr:A24 family peptidase [Sphingomonas aracearum]
MNDWWLWPAGLALLGAVLGSFLATIVLRWPHGRSVVGGRSACDRCHRTLTARDLVPLLSFAAAGGRCRYCAEPINWTHPQIEFAALLVGGLAGLAVPGPAGLAGAIFGWLLLVLAALDISDYWLPDRLTATLALAGLATGLLGIAPPLAERLIGGAGGFAALWAIGEGYRRLRGREGLGGGDPKLFGAIGLWLGWRLLPVVLFLAALTGLCVVLVGMLTGRRAALTDRAPFGALLAVAAYPAWLFLLGSS